MILETACDCVVETGWFKRSPPAKIINSDAKIGLKKKNNNNNRYLGRIGVEQCWVICLNPICVSWNTQWAALRTVFVVIKDPPHRKPLVDEAWFAIDRSDTCELMSEQFHLHFSKQVKGRTLLDVECLPALQLVHLQFWAQALFDLQQYLYNGIILIEID